MDNTVEKNVIDENCTSNNDNTNSDTFNNTTAVSAEKKGTTGIKVTEQGSAQLMKSLYQRGYFQKQQQLGAIVENSKEKSSHVITTKLYSNKTDFVPPKLYCNSNNIDNHNELSTKDNFYYFDNETILIPLLLQNNKSDNDSSEQQQFTTVDYLIQKFLSIICGKTGINDTTTTDDYQFKWTVHEVSIALRIPVSLFIEKILSPVLLAQYQRQKENPKPSLEEEILRSDADSIKDSFPNLLVMQNDRILFPVSNQQTSSSIWPTPKNDESITKITQMDGASILLNDQYLTSKFESLKNEIHATGKISLSDVCDHYYTKLSKAMVLSIVQNKKNEQYEQKDESLQLTSIEENGSTVIVTNSYLHECREIIISKFRDHSNAGNIISISAFAGEYKWDRKWIYEIIRDACHAQKLSGTIHGDNDSFIPTQFVQEQLQHIWDTYCSQGYVCIPYFLNGSSRIGITVQQAKEYITQQSLLLFSTKPILVDDAATMMFHPIVLVTPVKLVLQEAATTSSWVDLQSLIPLDLLEKHTNDVRIVVNELMTSKTGSSEDQGTATKNSRNVMTDVDNMVSDESNHVDISGVACIRPYGALYFSQGMIQAFKTEKLPLAIELYTKRTATELFEKQKDNNSMKKLNTRVDSAADPLSGKEKNKVRKDRKSRKQRGNNDDDDDDFFSEFVHNEDSTILLSGIVDELVTVYPDLLEINDTRNSCAGNILFTICKEAFVTTEVETSVVQKIRDQIDELQQASAKKFKQLSGPASNVTTNAGRTKAAISKTRDVQAAFEDPSCFATSCYMIQSIHKFIVYASECSAKGIIETSIFNSLEREFLVGYCANFTRVLTEYSFYKNQIDYDEIIKIQRRINGISQDKEIISNEQMSMFYDPIDTSMRTYEHVYLTTDNKQNQGEDDSIINPLAVLRDILPGSLGVSLARQWILCGDECYENNYNKDARPGNMEGFLNHVQENCLSICGLPFTKLDKKAEKKFLTERRQLLTRQFELASDAETVLEISIMLLYQLVKNMVVLGEHLLGPILELLLQERKITDASREALSKFSAVVKTSKHEITDEMIITFKQEVFGKELGKRK